MFLFITFDACMHFIYPDFLWALLLLFLPIIIHFFNIRKYKKIYFSDISLLKKITEQKQIKNKLKEILILISRLLALFFLIMAFAQPVLKKNQNNLDGNNTNVIIYIDNSFSMENVSKEGKLIEVSINKAKEIINSFPKSTKFYVFTNDMNFNQTKHLSYDESLDLLSKIKITSASLPLSILFKKIQTLNLSNPVLFILSDAQKKFTDISNIPKTNITTYYFLISPTQKNNISIDSVWVDNPIVLPNNPQQLHIKITNHNSDNVNNLPVKLLLNGVQVSVLNVSIPSHQSIKTTTYITPTYSSFQFGKIFINDYPMTFDDELYFSINSNIRLKVLLINGSHNPVSAKYLESFFRNDSIFIFSEQQEKQINFSEIDNQDVVIINELTEISSGLEEQLKILCNKGKTVIVIPYIQNERYYLPSDLQQYQWKQDTSIQYISNHVLFHPLFHSAFEKTNEIYKMPSIKNYIYTDYVTYLEPIILFNNEKPLLYKYTKNNWNYFLFTSTLDSEKNKLPLHPLFVPLMYQLCFTSIPVNPLYYYCKTTQNIKVPTITFNSDNSPKIISVNAKENPLQIIPIFKAQGFVSYISIPADYDIVPGHYFLQWRNQNMFSLSFNFNRAESDMQFYSEKELINLMNSYNLKNFKINELSSVSAQKIIKSEIEGQSYWKLCLFLSLLFFTTESLIIHHNEKIRNENNSFEKSKNF